MSTFKLRRADIPTFSSGDSGWVGQDFKLPDEAKKELVEILPEKHIPAVERACNRYLAMSKKVKIPLPKLGRILADLTEKSDELLQLIEKSTEAMRLVATYLHEPKRSGSEMLYEIDVGLRKLSWACREARAFGQLADPKRGRPTRSYARERFLASQLFEIYRAAHGGKIPKLAQMTKAGAILRFIDTLKLGSDMTYYFREILKEHKRTYEGCNSKDIEA